MIHIVKPGETIAMIAANYRVPLRDLYKNNPGLVHLSPGQKIWIPGLDESSLLPYVIRVSLRKRTLTIFKNGRFFKIYPIAIGKMLTQTPFGEYVIVNREPLPGGPFGVMWLSLSRAGYGIHGTNNPSSIGKAVSHGCIRMYNQDVLQLASIIPNGTKVIIEL